MRREQGAGAAVAGLKADKVDRDEALQEVAGVRTGDRDDLAAGQDEGQGGGLVHAPHMALRPSLAKPFASRYLR